MCEMMHIYFLSAANICPLKWVIIFAINSVLHAKENLKVEGYRSKQ